MVSAGLRWGLIFGAVAALLGAGAQALGYSLLSHAGQTDSGVGALLITGFLALLALTIALGLAYVAGILVERDRPRTALTDEAKLLDPGMVNRGPGLAGLLVMALYWVVTTVIGVAAGSRLNGPTDPSSFLATRTVLGLVLLAFGFGLGALGGRSPAARSLLDEIAKGPASPSAPLSPPDRMREPPSPPPPPVTDAGDVSA